jgi:ABC-type transport system involved in multi-copper enzyme maturation permease subunit
MAEDMFCSCPAKVNYTHMTESKIRKRTAFSTLKRRARRFFTKRTLFWLLIIALCSLIMSAFTVATSSLIEKFYKFMDTSYRPMDTDRMTYELEKKKTVGRK